MLKKFAPILAALAVALPSSVPAAAQTTMLHHAAMQSVERTRALLRHRDPDARTQDTGTTALHWALGHGLEGGGPNPLSAAERAEIVLILMDEGGASPLVGDNDGVTPLHLAARGYSSPNAAVLRLVIDANRGRTRFDPNTADNAGNTPLDWAMDFSNRIPSLHRRWIISDLMQAGADPTRLNGSGVSPLHAAAQRSLEIVRLMLDVMRRRGVDVDHGDRNGRSPLYWALNPASSMEDGTPEEIVSLLMENGADPEYPAGPGQVGLHNNSALKHALDNETPGRTAALIARMDTPAENGTPRVLDAFQNNRLQEMELLLRLGADVNVVDNRGLSFLESVLFSGRVDMPDLVGRLIEAGADVNRAGKLGTPLQALLHYGMHDGQDNDVAVKTARRLLAAGSTAGPGEMCKLAEKIRERANKGNLDILAARVIESRNDCPS